MMSSFAFVAAAAACLLFAAPVFSKSDAEAARTYEEASSILNNLLHDSKHVVFANQKDGILPTAAHLAFNSLLTKVTTGNLVTTAQQTIVQQLGNVIQLLAKQGPKEVLAAFVNQSNTMIETLLKSNVRRGLANLSALVNNSFTQGYQQCDTTYAASVSPTGTVMSLTQAFVPLVPDYQSCRATQSTYQISMTQAANLAASLSAIQVSKCATFSALDSSTLNCPTLTGENASAYALRMSGFFQQQNSNWTFLRSDCSSATISASIQNGTSQAAASSWATQKTTCDNKQDAMDAASCNVFTASVTACQNYQTCYTQFATSFQAYQQGYNSQLGGLISQWASLLQMQCLLNGVVNSSNSQNCSNQVLLTAQATQSLPLYYPSPLAAPSCTTAVGYAGTTTYVQSVYSVLPANAPAKFCVASCCPATTTTTTRVALISGSMSFNLPAASASQLRSALPAALAASLGVPASQVSVSVSGSSSPYAVTYFVSAPLTSQSSIQASINGFSTPATATTLQTNLASQLAVAGATVASSAVSVSGVSAPSSSTVGSQTLPNLASAVAVSAGSLTLNLGSVTGSTSTVQAAALNALTAYFGTSQVMTNVTLVRSTPLTFNVSYNVSFPIGSLPRLQTLSTGATSSALQTSLTTALSSSGVVTSSLSLQNFVAPVAGLVPASSVVIVATTTATTTTATTTTATTTTLTATTTATTTTLTTTTTQQLACGPCSVVFSQGYAPGYGDTQGQTSTMTTMNQWVNSYSGGISSLILSGQGCQLQVRTHGGIQSFMYTPGVYNCGKLPDGSPSPQTCLPTGNDNMVASIMTCQVTTTGVLPTAPSFAGAVRRPTYWFVADDYVSASQWPNRGSAGSNSPTVTGTLTRVRESGNGAQQAINSLRGSSGTSVVFGTNLITSDSFTICALTRYSGATKGRILNGGGNWLFGHWNGAAGIAHTQQWISSTSDARGANWVALCGKGGGTNAADLVLNGRNILTGGRVQRPNNGEITINSCGGSSCCCGEKSDFDIAELIIWPGDALAQGVAYLNRVLSSGQLMAIPIAPSFSGTTSSPSYWFVADDYVSASQWPNRGTAGGNSPVVTGTLTRTFASGNGAQQAINSLRGTVSTSAVFGTNLITSDSFTICALTRYSGATKGRILNGGGNWLFGHWSGKAGVAHTQQWITSTSDASGSNWVALCGRGGGTNAADLVLNGTNILTGGRVQRPNNGEITINSCGGSSCCCGETSDFDISELIIWPRDALAQGVAYLNSVLNSGRLGAQVMPSIPSFAGSTTWPSYWFVADDYVSASVWPNRGTAGGNSPVVTGFLSRKFASGNGAQQAIHSLSGSVSTAVIFGTNLITSDSFTICALTRYSGASKGRILNGGGNWLFGHWAGNAGVAHTQQWITSASGASGQNWVALCGRGGGTNAADLVLNGRNALTGGRVQRPNNGEITINSCGGSSCCCGEKSDFDISELIIWPGDALAQGVAYLNAVLSSGRPGSKAPTAPSFTSRPSYWFMADDYVSASQWPNRGTAGGNSPAVTGILTKKFGSGNGAQEAITSLSGSVSTAVVFGTNLITSDSFTICALTRYSGATKGRILNGGGNWLFGHWNGAAGIAHTQQWISSTSDARGSNWVALCGRGGGTAAADLVLNGRNILTGGRVQRPNTGEITINSCGGSSCCCGEKSDFDIAELIIWPGDALDQGVAYLNYVLSYGRSGTQAPVLPTQSLVARYDASNNPSTNGWTDLSGNGYHLTATGSVAQSTTINGLATLDFSNGQRYTRSGVPLNSYDVTVVMVVTTTSGSWPTWANYMHHGNRDSDWSMEHMSNTNRLQFQSLNDNAGNQVQLDLNTHYIFVGTYASRVRSLTVYSISGARVGSSTATDASYTMSLGSKTLYVGSSDIGERSNAKFNEILYYSRAISTSEVAGLVSLLSTKWSPSTAATTATGWTLLASSSSGNAGAVSLSNKASSIQAAGGKLRMAWSTDSTPSNLNDFNTYEKVVEFTVPGTIGNRAAGGDRQCTSSTFVQVSVTCVKGSCNLPSTMYTGAGFGQICYGNAYGLVLNQNNPQCDWTMDGQPFKSLYLGGSGCHGIKDNAGTAVSGSSMKAIGIFTLAR